MTFLKCVVCMLAAFLILWVEVTIAIPILQWADGILKGNTTLLWPLVWIVFGNRFGLMFGVVLA